MILPEARAPLTYNYDAISRLTSISETQGSSIWTAASATYNSANLMTNLTYGPNGPQFSETRTYNNLLQLIRDTVTGGSSTLMDMQYVFPSGANNGKVSQTTDGVLGETVNYQYDALNRLIAATASNNSWGEAYSFDGFGNLQSKTPTVGSAPTGGGASPATNQPTGVSVDVNGNTLGNGSTPYVWDIENHMISSSTTTSPTYFYYDPWGKRVWNETFTSAGASSGGEFSFYGIGGQKLETYSFNSSYGYSLEGINLYFGAGGKLLQSKGVWVATDRQGTVRANSNSESFSYFPYGEERTSTANGREKFGSYTRDANGQDYADQRYYNSNSGAFWSPDPGGSVGLQSPTNWNEYGVGTDPINRWSVSGLRHCNGASCFSPQIVVSVDLLAMANTGAAGGPLTAATKVTTPTVSMTTPTMTAPIGTTVLGGPGSALMQMPASAADSSAPLDPATALAGTLSGSLGTGTVDDGDDTNRFSHGAYEPSSNASSPPSMMQQTGQYLMSADGKKVAAGVGAVALGSTALVVAIELATAGPLIVISAPAIGAALLGIALIGIGAGLLHSASK